MTLNIYFSAITWVFPLQNNSIDLDPSFKTDLDLRDRFGCENLRVIWYLGDRIFRMFYVLHILWSRSICNRSFSKVCCAQFQLNGISCDHFLKLYYSTTRHFFHCSTKTLRYANMIWTDMEQELDNFDLLRALVSELRLYSTRCVNYLETFLIISCNFILSRPEDTQICPEQ